MDDCVACSVKKRQNDEIFCQLGVASPVLLACGLLWELVT